MGQKRKTINSKVKQTIKKLLKRFKEEHFEFQQIYLFGSHAKGFGRADSDIDLCIVQDDTFEKHHLREWSCALRIAGELMISADIVLTTEHEFRTNLVSPLIHEIRNSGIQVA